MVKECAYPKKVMKLFKTDSKGNFSVNVDDIDVEAIITILTSPESDAMPVMTNGTLVLVSIFHKDH